MKITRELHDFGARQNSDSYLTATVPVEDAEAGMAEMREVFWEKGNELYLPDERQNHHLLKIYVVAYYLVPILLGTGIVVYDGWRAYCWVLSRKH